MTAPRPTIIDVARAAGVSKSTVSLVLQNSPLVKEDTRLAVREAIRDIGYVYNRAAANLRQSNVGLIGQVINDLRNPFFAEFATSFQMALSARGYATVLANTDEDAGVQDQVVGAMIEHGVSALVISPAYGETQPTFDALGRTGLPVMQVLRRVDPRVERFPFAAPDYPAGSRAATEHLLACGARRVAFVGGVAGRSVTEERRAGYLAAMQAAGRDPLILSGPPTRSFGRGALRELAGADAALCFNDQVALGVIAGAAQVGRSLGPDGLRLIGFDDIEEAAQSWPPLSSVRCDVAGFGGQVAATLLGWLEGGDRPAPEIRPPVTLALRGSSEGVHP